MQGGEEEENYLHFHLPWSFRVGGQLGNLGFPHLKPEAVTHHPLQAAYGLAAAKADNGRGLSLVDSSEEEGRATLGSGFSMSVDMIHPPVPLLYLCPFCSAGS